MVSSSALTPASDKVAAAARQCASGAWSMRIVHANWLKACIVQRRLCDVEPFLLNTAPLASPTPQAPEHEACERAPLQILDANRPLFCPPKMPSRNDSMPIAAEKQKSERCTNVADSRVAAATPVDVRLACKPAAPTASHTWSFFDALANHARAHQEASSAQDQACAQLAQAEKCSSAQCEAPQKRVHEGAKALDAEPRRAASEVRTAR